MAILPVLIGRVKPQHFVVFQIVISLYSTVLSVHGCFRKTSNIRVVSGATTDPAELSVVMEIKWLHVQFEVADNK